MKIGDKIIARIQAFDVKNKKYITYGKEYTITNQSGFDFAIIDDLGNTKYYPPNEFNQFFKIPELKINWLTKEETTTFQTLEPKKATTGNKIFGSTPSYYDNTNGTIYKVQKDRGWNAYVFDVVKRLERAEKKGEFLSDIDKCIKVLELYRDEQGHNFKGQFEPLNK